MNKTILFFIFVLITFTTPAFAQSKGDSVLKTKNLKVLPKTGTGNNAKNNITVEKEFVEINGLKWATKNVGAKNAPDAGNYYTWKEAQKACPAGWRLPTKKELQMLVDSGSRWTGEGRGFSNEQFFLPAAGYYASKVGDIDGKGTQGAYWCSTSMSENYAFSLSFLNNEAGTNFGGDKKSARSVRCIAK